MLSFSKQVEGPNQDPQFQSPDGMLWPAILMENQPDPDHQTDMDFAFENPAQIPPLLNMPIKTTEWKRTNETE